MSHIFDALQRSEDERTESDLSASAEPTELLRRAERRALQNWETAVLHKKGETAEGAVRERSFARHGEAPAAKVEEAAAVGEETQAEAQEDIFAQFQTLHVALSPQDRLVCSSNEESMAAEAFRLLGVRLRHLRRDRPLKKVLITSTIPQEGKSLVAANLAWTLALTTQQKVLLLEGDLRRPSLSKVFGLERHQGLCECLQGGPALAKSIYHLQNPGFWILPAGSAQSNALEMLQSGRLAAIMDHLAGWFDWIIIDSPPVLPLADTSVWARMADGILLVTRQGITEKRYLQRGIEALEPKKLIGALVNSSKTSSENDYYYTATNVPQPRDESAS